jgi:CBS domain-containing protein
MMPVVFAIADDTTIAAAAALMAGEGIHRLPVLDGTGAVVGILSTLDVVRWVAERAGYDV